MRALRTALTLLLLAGLLECEGVARKRGSSDDADDDEDSDEAPFMIVIEHVSRGGREGAGAGAGAGAEWRCSGSLVSLRTGVTSAECARARPEMRELWALAAATAAGLASREDGARRVSRVATAGTNQQDFVAGEWNNALLDLAVLELESPFSSNARARPILMATATHECSENPVCHVVRSLAARAGRTGARLRIVDAALGTEAACAASVREWPALRERALCLTGPQLCQSEWGAGVVCGGKLCGVLSRSAARGGGGSGSGSGRHCGDVHAAQAVARWRRFLHCAHTLRACGRGSCAKMCSEQRLLVNGRDGDAEGSSAAPPAPGGGAGAGGEPERELELGVEPEHAEHAEHAQPHHHAVDLDLAHLARPTYAAEYANSTRLVQATRTPLRVSEPPQQTSMARLPVFMRASAGRAGTRTAWSAAPPAARTGSPARAPHSPAPAPPPLTPPSARASERPPATPDFNDMTVFTTPFPFDSEFTTRRPLPPATPALLPKLTPAASSSSVRPTPLFEPNRPDFRAGEYGDNGAEYVIPEDGFPFKKTSHAPPSFASSAARPRPRARPTSPRTLSKRPPPPHRAPPSKKPPEAKTAFVAPHHDHAHSLSEAAPARVSPPALPHLLASRGSHESSNVPTLTLAVYMHSPMRGRGWGGEEPRGWSHIPPEDIGHPGEGGRGMPWHWSHVPPQDVEHPGEGRGGMPRHWSRVPPQDVQHPGEGGGGMPRHWSHFPPHDIADETLYTTPDSPSDPHQSLAFLHVTALFEINRPDFQVGAYGDNAAEYGELVDYGPPPPRRRTLAPAPRPPPRTAPPTPPAPRTPRALSPPPPPARAPLPAPRRDPSIEQPAKPVQMLSRENKSTSAASVRLSHSCSTFTFILLYNVI